MITLIAEKNYSPNAAALYRKLGPVYFWFEMSLISCKKILEKADILVVRLAVDVDRKLIDAAPNLKIIATSTTGLNHIDIDYAEERGIKIISLRGQTAFLSKISSTAEEAFALILSLVRNVPWAFDDIKAGRWEQNKWAGHELKGKTLGLLGFGRLGKIVARYAKAFGVNVISADPFVPQNIMKKSGVKKVQMEFLFKNSDIVSLHVLLTEKTHNLIKTKHLKMMKKTVYLINTARAELIEKGALHRALKNKWIKGAAVDVLWDERSTGSHLRRDPLWKYSRQNKNLIILPHVGGTTWEAMHSTQDFLAQLVLKNLKSKKNKKR